MKSFFLCLWLTCSFGALYSQINYINWTQGTDLSLPANSSGKIDVFVFVPGTITAGVVKLPAESQNFINSLERNSPSLDFENFAVHVVRAVEVKSNVAAPNVPMASSLVCKKMGLLGIGRYQLSTAFTIDPFFILIDTTFFDRKEPILTKKKMGKDPVSLVPFKDGNGSKTIPFVECHSESDMYTFIINQEYNFGYLLNELNNLTQLVNELRDETFRNRQEIDSLNSKLGSGKKKF